MILTPGELSVQSILSGGRLERDTDFIRCDDAGTEQVVGDGGNESASGRGQGARSEVNWANTSHEIESVGLILTM